MVAAGVLGVALLGLVELHRTSMGGTARSMQVAEAAEVARQIAEQVASQPLAQLPNCAPGAGVGGGQLPAGPNGCRATLGPGTAYAAPRLPPCTYTVNSAAVMPSDPAAFPDAMTASETRKYRVDMAVSQHPDFSNFPNSALITVWVCWQDTRGFVQEYSTSRVVIQ